MMYNLSISKCIWSIKSKYIKRHEVYRLFSVDECDSEDLFVDVTRIPWLFNKLFTKKTQQDIHLLKTSEGKNVLYDYDAKRKILMGKIEYSHMDNCYQVVGHMFSKIWRFDIIDSLLFYVHQIHCSKNNRLVLHGAAIDYKGQGIVFSAPSETGKSTQANLWKRVLGAKTINGDRPTLIFEKDEVFVGTSPWSGSDPEIYNVVSPLKAIIVLEQGPDNHVVRLSVEDALRRLLPRVFTPYFDEALVDMTMKTLEKVVLNVPVYLFSCRPDENAVHVIQKELGLL